MKDIKKIMISACELSADKYAAQLAIEIKRINPNIHIFGVGSDASRQAGIDVRCDISGLSTVGLVEPLRYLPKLLKALHKVKQMLEEEKPDIFIPIDNQGFHMQCCKKSRALGIATYYFIAPQHWHWGEQKHGKQVARYVDHVLAIFPQEAAFYKRSGLPATYVGHPCVDRVKKARRNRNPESVLGLFPGSRRQEIERLLPVFLQAAQISCAKHKLRCTISVAAKQYQSLVESIVTKHAPQLEVDYVLDNALDLMAKAKMSVVTSGTVSLEHALMGVPHVVAYKFNPITYWVAQTFFKKTLKRIPFMGMPNILLNKEVFTELLQHKASPDNINQALTNIIQHHYEYQVEQCNKLWETLNTGKVSQQLAKTILS